MNDGPVLGKLIEGEERRDAVHVAVAPVEAGEVLSPGSRVELRNGKAFEVVKGGIGIVDPFLVAGPDKDQKFWLFLYPNTVTGMRHQWSHPAFVRSLKPAKEDMDAV